VIERYAIGLACLLLALALLIALTSGERR